MEKEKQIWILVPMRSDESKKTFTDFVKERTGKDITLPKQYKDGTIMLLVSPDLLHYGLINYTCAASADFKTNGVSDFVENYDDFKRRYDIAQQQIKEDFTDKSVHKGICTRFPKDLYFHKNEKKCHYDMRMPDGSLLGLWTYYGEDDETQIKSFIDNWYRVTSQDPMMYGHSVALAQKCKKCGGTIHYKKTENGTYFWCIDCHDKYFKE